MPKQEEFLDINDAARALNVKPWTMRRWANKGRFNWAEKGRIVGAFKTGDSRTNPWRFPRSALDRFIRERQKERGQANK